jgi:hypothetical protein
VLDGLLTALPRDPGRVAALVGRLGPSAASTLGVHRLADLLVGLSADERADRVLPTDLPVTKIDAGGPPAYHVDPAQTAAFVRANLGASWPESARRPRTRVLVQNGVGTPGLVDAACRRLTAAGYQFVGSGNADSFGQARSTVLVFSGSISAAQVGDGVARTLRLPVSDVQRATQGQTVADVVVILGKDFKP